MASHRDFRPPEKSPPLSAVLLKWASLGFLVVQNSGLVIAMRYSRLSSDRYESATAVLISEILKFAISIIIFRFSRPSIGLNPEDKERLSPVDIKDTIDKKDGNSTKRPTYLRELNRYSALSEDWKVVTIPAVVYYLQNNLQYIAMSHLQVATFQVLYQLKVLTTALFSVWLLRRQLSSTKWLALLLLAGGVAFVQLSMSQESSPTKEESLAPDLAGHVAEVDNNLFNNNDNELNLPTPWWHLDSVGSRSSQALGVVAVVIACVLSGFAGVWFEKLLKKSKATLWTRNVQLSFFSLFPAIFGVWSAYGHVPSFDEFFKGYNSWTYVTILSQALGGLLVSLVVR
ncbi:nucleotide-sugar transporter-domain-containing protein [Cladochytrium replicatum]|nr:nucleotide-sugar transporter-domain-containing protein [Cladochytrium replicatum]